MRRDLGIDFGFSTQVVFHPLSMNVRWKISYYLVNHYAKTKGILIFNDSTFHSISSKVVQDYLKKETMCTTHANKRKSNKK